jgi:hypothetical protein
MAPFERTKNLSASEVFLVPEPPSTHEGPLLKSEIPASQDYKIRLKKMLRNRITI